MRVQVRFAFSSHWQNAGQICKNKDSWWIPWNCGKAQICGNVKNFMHEEVKSRLNSRTACCCQVQDVLSLWLLSNTVGNVIHRTVILLVFVWVCNLICYIQEKMWVEGVRTGCWGRYLGLKVGEVTGDWRKLCNKVLHDLYSVVDIRLIKWGWLYMWGM